ncbi:MAG TPA: SPFH domain-containing protein [Roseiflexaceae bacterium]|nr:SPFH domain-containing protein [Roseiflexaceae bacterium]
MNQKRKAAANVFMEQQQLDEAPDLAQAPASLAAPQAAPGMPPPALAPGAPPREPQRAVRSRVPQDGLKTSEELQLEKEPIRVRETGLWFWRRVIVPPNAYVVHTRMGRQAPVTLGLGLSFRYDPYKDSYLVVPAAMQTIGVVAYCISKEKQGINVLAYVQWQINDFGVAYRKLDFSDSRDPLGIVNAQLREQAEAAIKDKIATMSVEEVLTDKEPVIEELTSRLKTVAEGRGQSDQAVDEGLGIKIVTVQIKEALVSSQRLWQDLQAPFRYEQEKTARISYLASQDEIRQKELETRQAAETSEAETMVAIERIKQGKQTEALELRLNEEATRFTKEQESARQKIQLEEQTTLIKRESDQRLRAQAARAEQELKLETLRQSQAEAIERVRLDAEASARQKILQVEQALQELAEETRLAEQRLQADLQRIERETTLKQQDSTLKLLVQEQADLLQGRVQEAGLARTRQETLARLELQEATNHVTIALAEREAELDRLRQEIRNLMNERDLSSQLIEKLPELAARMPEVHELKVLHMGDGDGAFDALPAFLAKMLAIADSMGIRLVADKQEETRSA